ncbi:MAG: hypothetical protein WBQ78_14250 [Gammaproteobacteria bacterium]
MKYSSLMFAAALALTGMTFASEENTVPGDTGTGSPAEMEADAEKKANCVADFIASDLDEDKKDQYIADCMQGTADKSLGAD